MGLGGQGQTNEANERRGAMWKRRNRTGQRKSRKMDSEREKSEDGKGRKKLTGKSK